ncbi:MAG TPA: hypothetical protein DIT64_05410 [Verrucomicrobiales bacterium]|nr:hypothetical protein [Verrucomicrobiales bacterium]
MTRQTADHRKAAAVIQCAHTSVVTSRASRSSSAAITPATPMTPTVTREMTGDGPLAALLPRKSRQTGINAVLNHPSRIRPCVSLASKKIE